MSVAAGHLSQFKHDLLTLHIQGATAVARATLQALTDYVAASAAPTTVKAWRRLQGQGEELSGLRPTEPLARNIIRWYLRELKTGWLSGRLKAAWPDVCRRLQDDISYRLSEAEAKVAGYGSKLVRPGQIIFTHCHSSLAERILVEAYRAGRRFQVYHTETRPLFQGRLTDKRLRGAGIPSVMVVDSAAAYLVSNHSGDEVSVSWVLLGADSLARDGSVINKIGSFGIALAAYDSRIPVYVATTLLKLDWRGETKIELRRESEVWPRAPRGAKIVNYAFDKIPAEYIKGIICEFGIVKPNQVAKLVKRHYPWLVK
ncbi:MAG: translation initiation factor eIF-2B [Candidatus Kerfeldbacteria bacterium]|nr:translation initiation factor eIF-2B [Candidatus Kerfeldbacteria bacterium]